MKFPNCPLVFTRLWSFATLILVVATWPLWWSSTDAGCLPAVPMLAGPWAGETATVANVLVSRVAMAALIVALVIALVSAMFVSASFRPKCVRAAWACAAISLLILFVLNQHRLQPWAYQSFLYFAIFACAPSVNFARRCILLVAASVYFYSALGKFDYQFVHTVGPQFLQQASDALGGFLGRKVFLSDEMSTRLSFVIPSIEILAAALLLVRRTRVIAVMILVGMHSSLIALLGPWGLGHSWGVLLWNATLIGQAIYFLADRKHESCHLDHFTPGRAWLAVVGVTIALFAPLGERASYWDHWLSWSLYSPHTSGADVQVHASVISDLPAEVQEFVEDDEDGDGWRGLSLQRWSLESRWAPIYPQSRYQVAVADELAGRYDLQRGVRVISRSVSDRWSGKREQKWLMGSEEIAAYRDTFWLAPR